MAGYAKDRINALLDGEGIGVEVRAAVKALLPSVNAIPPKYPDSVLDTLAWFRDVHGWYWYCDGGLTYYGMRVGDARWGARHYQEGEDWWDDFGEDFSGPLALIDWLCEKCGVTVEEAKEAAYPVPEQEEVYDGPHDYRG